MIEVKRVGPDEVAVGEIDASDVLARMAARARAAREAAATEAAASPRYATAADLAVVVPNELTGTGSTNGAVTAGTSGLVIIEGIVVFVPFADEASGFRVLKIRTDDGRNLSAVGKSGRVAVGDRVRCSGVMERDVKRGGMQLRATEIAAVAPVDEEGLAQALARCAVSGGVNAAPGFGPGRARAWVRAIGGARQALAFLADGAYASDSAPFAPVPSGVVLPAPVVAAWRRGLAEREADAALATLGLPPGLRRRIVEKHGAASAAAVRADPYAIAREVDGVGWATAERIAESVGIGRDDPRRARGAVSHALERAAAEDGHTALDAAELRARVERMASVPELVAHEATMDLVESGGLIKLSTTDRALGRLREDQVGGYPVDLIAERRHHDAERAIADAFSGAAERPSGSNFSAPPRTVAWDGLSDEQRAAALAAISDPRHVITGPAGVGKTTVLRAIVEALDARGETYELCAPTARAARRMAEATGRPARTIHRMLGWGGGGARWEFHRGNPLPADVCVVDEAGMVGSSLMSSVVDAIRPGARLVLLGDPNQLSPVDPGDPFRDLIDCGAVPTSRLTRIYRQAAASRIISFARGLLDGRVLDASPRGDRTDGCLIKIDTSMSSEAAAAAVDIYCDEVARAAELSLSLVGEVHSDPAHLGARTREDVIVLSPMRRGACGVEALNAAIQARVNPARDGVAQIVRPRSRRAASGGNDAADPTFLRVGDRARQTKNDYNLGVVNGELGEIVAIEPRAGRERLTLRTDDGREVEYDREAMGDLTLAYAGTVHGAQGQGFPVAIVLFAREHRVMASRSLLYTAVTRASRACVLIGDRRVIEAAAADRRREPRTTMLRAMMATKMNEGARDESNDEEG